MRRVLGIAVACAMIAGVGITAVPAGAKTIKPYVYSGKSFNGSDSTAGTFTVPSGVAVDDASGSVFVLDNGHGGVLDKFDFEGKATSFSELSGSTIPIGTWSTLGCGTATGVNTGGGVGVAVDNSGGAGQGNLFVMRNACSPNATTLFGFKPGGTTLNANFPECGLTCGKPDNFQYPFGGIAVDEDGDPWIGSQTFLGGSPGYTVNPIDAVTGQLSTTKTPLTLAIGNDNAFISACCKPGATAFVPTRVDFDSQGNFYVSAGSQPGFGGVSDLKVLKYAPNGELLNPAFAPGITQIGGDTEYDKASDRLFVANGNRVEVYDAGGSKVDNIGLGSLSEASGVALNPTSKDLYITNRAANTVDIYKPGAEVVVPDVTTLPAKNITQESATLEGIVNTDNGGSTTECFFQFGKTSAMTGQELAPTVPCNPASPLPSQSGPQTVTATISGLNCSFPGFCPEFVSFENGAKWYYRLVAKNAAGPQQAGKVQIFRNALAPKIATPDTRNVNTDSVDIRALISPEGGDTKYKVEYGPTASYGETYTSELVFDLLTRPEKPQNVVAHLEGLEPNTTYHYKVVAESDYGTAETTDRTFHTFQALPFSDKCPNALSRQQTGAASLLDCRSYELVSAADQGGYNVESDLVQGQNPYAGYPDADGRVLYGIHAGGVPNSGEPTNRGVDPYIAARGDHGWTTKYVGIPVSAPSALPFASTLAGADAGLSTFVFGGKDICDPCFADGSAGMPLRLPNGNLIQGMEGPEGIEDPTPSGTIAKPLSADGTHFVFGSTQQFTEDATDGQPTIYDRNLATGTTSVVSKTPGGANFNSATLAELDISGDGSRILLGDKLGEDTKGNAYYHLYMNVGDSEEAIDLMPTASAGARYDGMTADGTEVFFTTKDKLQSDTDTSADLYRADVSASSSSLTRISTGASAGDTDSGCNPASNWNVPSGSGACDVLAIAGGGGVASEDGTVFFLSPEQLDGPSNGTVGQPNLYIARPGAAPHFVVTLETSNPAVKHGIEAAGTRNTADFQVNPSGDVAAFGTTLSLTEGFENRGFSEVYRYDAGADELVCVSCPASNVPGTGNSSLASKGLSITDDGRVFFNSPDPLVLRDSNNILDAYEWEKGAAELISTGTDSSTSSLLSVTADGKDAYFYTREEIVAEDLNGRVAKVYDARENGGFFLIPSQQRCKASDECHGAGTEAPPVLNPQSPLGAPGQSERPKVTCRKGFVKKHGKCVKKKPSKKKSSKKRKGGRR